MGCFIALKRQIADAFFFEELESSVTHLSSCCCLALLLDQVLLSWPKLGVCANTDHDLGLICGGS